MAKSQDIVIVYGESFGADSPKAAHEKAAKAFADGAKAASEAAKALSRKLPTAGDIFPHIKTPAQILARTESWGDVATKSVAHMPTIRANVERNVAQRSIDIAFACVACGMKWETYVDDELHGDIEPVIAASVANIEYSHPESIAHGSRYWCSQCPQEDRLIDGLTSRECLENYSNQQRTDECHPNMQTSWRAVNPLTPLQLAAARTAWSAELRKRQAAAREKERCVVVVDWQDEP